MARLNLYLVAIFLGASFATIASAKATPTDSGVVKALGAELAEVLLSPDRIEVYRLDGKGENGLVLDGCAVTKTGPELNAAQRKAVVQLVGDITAFGPSKKNCVFNPGMGLRFVKGDKQVVMLICFECEDWGFNPPDGELAVADFSRSAVQPQLVALAMALFPDDK